MKIDKPIFNGIPAEFGEICDSILRELKNDNSNLEFDVSNYIYRTSSGGALELNADANPVNVWFRFGGMESFCAIEAKKLPRRKSCLTILMIKAGKSQGDPWEPCSSEEGKENWLRLKTVWEQLQAELEQQGWLERPIVNGENGGVEEGKPSKQQAQEMVERGQTNQLPIPLLHKKILEAYNQGLSCKEIAQIFRKKQGTIRNIIKDLRKQYGSEIAPYRRTPCKRTPR